MRIPNPRVGERLALARARDGAHLCGHGQGGRRAFGSQDRPVGAHDLCVALRSAERGIVAVGGLRERASAARVAETVAVVVGEFVCARSEGVVDLLVQLRSSPRRRPPWRRSAQ